MPKVLIADELSPKALDIFRSRGLEVDVHHRAQEGRSAPYHRGL